MTRIARPRRKMRFVLVYLTLAFTIESSLDSTDETVCEHQDANITWPNTTTNSVVKAQLWYKGNTTLMAKWRKEDGFDVFPQYTDRLIQIGQSGINLKKANRSDSGTYLLIQKMEDANNTANSVTSLQVIVAPSRDCVPKISRKGDTLLAELPRQGCGSPSLTPDWKNCTQKLVNDTISIIICESGLVPGTYTVCSTGISLNCIQENETSICSHYTVSALELQNENSYVLVEGILILIMFVACVFYFVCRICKSIKRKLFPSIEQSLVLHNRTEENPLIQEETSATASIEQSLVLHNLIEENPLIQEETSVTASIEQSLVLHNRTEESPLIQEETSATAAAEAGSISHRHSDKNPLRVEETSATGLTLTFGNTANMSEINMKIVFKETQMQHTQRHDPGLPDTREDSREGNQAFQASEDPTHEEQSISTEKDDVMPEEQQMQCGTCHKEKPCMILVPCGHMDACFPCAQRLDKCTQCKKKVSFTIRAFFR